MDILSQDDLAPGVRRMRPDDHFMVLSETDASPMHVGALLVLAVPETEKAGFHGAVRRQLAERLPLTPLLARLRQSPEGHDSDVWVDDAAVDLDALIQSGQSGGTWDDPALRADIARRNMQRLDLGGPPFAAVVYDRLEGDRCAIYVKMHHAVADGIGFQSILRLLSDATPAAPPRQKGGELPSDVIWRAVAEARFEREAPLREAHAARRKEATEALRADPSLRRSPTPVLKLSGPTAPVRAYATLSLPLARLKAIGAALDGTVNDIFLSLAGTALRRYLQEIGDLPDDPIVVNSARSYRRPEHGPFGNRIVAQNPHLATHIADPFERLRAIQAAMALEKRRTGYDEVMLDSPEKPFGARDRRAAFAQRAEGGKAIIPGNITLSNVPGPAERFRFAGYAQVANFPVPIIGSSRFLNITSRRNGESLDMGVIVDPTKITDVDKVARFFVEAAGAFERAIAEGYR